MSTKHQPDALTGEPLTAEEQAAYAAWAESAERGDFQPAPDGAGFEGDEAAQEARALLDSIVGAAELDEAIGRGRPGLEGKAGAGPSQKRQVRLSRDVDALLVARAEREHVDLSVVMRRAIESYLRESA